MKIILTESQLNTVLKEISGKVKYPDLESLPKDELIQIAKDHFKKYRTLMNNKRLVLACIEKGIDIESFRKVTDAKKYRMMSDEELLKLGRTYGDYAELQRNDGVLYNELKKRGLSKNIFTPFKRHVNTEIPNDVFVKIKKDEDKLDDNRKYKKGFMFTPITEND